MRKHFELSYISLKVSLTALQQNRQGNLCVLISER